MHRVSFPFLLLVWRLIFLTAVIFIVAISTKPVAEPMITEDEITYNSATIDPQLLTTDEQTAINDSNTASEPDIICEPSNLNPPTYPDDFKYLQGKVEIFGPTYGFVGESITIWVRSENAVEYNAPNGTKPTFGQWAILTFTYPEPGEYNIFISAHDKEGKVIWGEAFPVEIKARTVECFGLFTASYYLPNEDKFVHRQLIDDNEPVAEAYALQDKIDSEDEQEIFSSWQGEINFQPGRYRLTLHPGNLGRIYINHQLIEPISRSVPSVDKMWVAELDGLTHIKVEWFDNVRGQDLQFAWERLSENPGPSEVQFDVYLVTRAETCIVGEPGNDVKVYNTDGSVAASFALWPGKTPRSIKPSTRMQGEYPEEICLTLELSPQEQEEIKAEIDTFARNIEEWTDGAIVPKIRIISIEGEIALQSFGTGWTIGPKNIKELASPYLDRNTDFIFLTHGIGDREKNLYLGIPYCGIGAYGELAGSGYSWLPKTSFWLDFECATASNYGHEWMHRLDVTLTQLMGLNDIYPSQYPPCGEDSLDSFSWFTNPDRVANEPDAPWCGSEPPDNDTVTRHLLEHHYDATMQHYAFSKLYGNHCSNGLQDFDETGIDEGGSCPINTDDFDPLPQLFY